MAEAVGAAAEAGEPLSLSDAGCSLAVGDIFIDELFGRKPAFLRRLSQFPPGFVGMSRNPGRSLDIKKYCTYFQKQLQI